MIFNRSSCLSMDLYKLSRSSSSSPICLSFSSNWRAEEEARDHEAREKWENGLSLWLTAWGVAISGRVAQEGEADG